MVAAILYVALLPSLFSYFIYNHATAIVGPARAGQSITLKPNPKWWGSAPKAGGVSRFRPV